MQELGLASWVSAPVCGSRLKLAIALWSWPTTYTFAPSGLIATLIAPSIPSATVWQPVGAVEARSFMHAAAPGSGVRLPVTGSREKDATASPRKDATYTFLPSGLTTEVMAPLSPSAD